MDILTEYCSSEIIFSTNTAMIKGVEKGDNRRGEDGGSKLKI